MELGVGPFAEEVLDRVVVRVEYEARQVVVVPGGALELLVVPGSAYRGTRLRGVRRAGLARGEKR